MLDTKDLKRIFQLTAVVSVAVVLLALFISPEWAIAYGALATMALLNWVALAQILAGFSGKNPLQMITGIMIKPLLLTALLIYAVKCGIEITSFLAAVNTFFLCLFIYMIGNSIRSGRSRDGRASIPTGSKEAHV